MYYIIIYDCLCLLSDTAHNLLLQLFFLVYIYVITSLVITYNSWKKALFGRYSVVTMGTDTSKRALS